MFRKRKRTALWVLALATQLNVNSANQIRVAGSIPAHVTAALLGMPNVTVSFGPIYVEPGD